MKWLIAVIAILFCSNAEAGIFLHFGFSQTPAQAEAAAQRRAYAHERSMMRSQQNHERSMMRSYGQYQSRSYQYSAPRNYSAPRSSVQYRYFYLPQ